MSDIVDLTSGGTTQVTSSGGLSKVSNTDPSFGYGLKKDALWLNHKTGEIFACVDDSGDLNNWVGQIIGNIMEEHTYNFVDTYGDGSCVAVYTMDGNSTDLSGNYSGTDTGMSYAEGIIDECSYFDGDGYIEIPTAMADEFDKEITMTAWVKLEENSDSEKIIFNAGAEIAEVQYKNNTIQVAFGDSWSLVDVQDVDTFDTFHFFAMTYNKDSGDFKLYMDNVKIYSDTNAGSKAILNPSNKIGIGARYDNDGNAGSKFMGYIDHVRVYNRVLRSYELWFLFKGVKFTDPTLGVFDIFDDGSAVALYQLDGDSTDTGGNYDGADTDVTYNAGNFGKAGVFNGSSSYITMGSWIGAINSAGNLSFSFWLKTTSTDDETIWSTDNLTSANSILFSSSNLQYWDNNSDKHLINYNSDYSDGNWHHIVGIIDTINNIILLYNDNIKIDSISIATNSGIEANCNMCLGGRSSTNHLFNGLIDQIRVFNRALTDKEVDILYKEG